MGTLKIGWAEKSITPDKKIALAGQFAERISEYVEKPLTVTSLAIDSGDDQLLLCSIDLVSVGWNLVQAVREEIRSQGAGIDPMKIVISAIHTHTGPVYPRTSRTDGTWNVNTFRSLLEQELPEGRQYVERTPIRENAETATEQEVFALLVSQTVAAILQAWENRTPGTFANGFGRAAVGMCRRVVYSDGSAKMWGDTNTAVFTALEGGNDSGVELLYFFDDHDALTGIAVNLACPAQCVQHRLFVSPDFWGEVKVLLRQRYGEAIFLLPLCSAAGDQCPVDLIRWVEPERDVHDPNLTRTHPLRRAADPSMFDLSGMRKVGKRIANEVMAVYEEGCWEKQADAVLTHHVRDLPLPLRRATGTEAGAAREAIRAYLQKTHGDVDYNDVAALQAHLGVLHRMELQETVEMLEAEVHLIRLGPVAIATNPFELFLDYGNQIKARSPAEQTFLVQLANGSEGYLPTEKAERGGHYSAFLASGKVGHEGGDLLVRETVAGIRRLFPA